MFNMASYDSRDFDFLIDDFMCFDDEVTSTTSEDFSSDDACAPVLSMIDVNSVIPKKKRIRKKRVVPVPVGPIIVKNDIRKTYANMFVNVLNSCDFHLMYGLLDTFCTNNFMQSFKKTMTTSESVHSHSYSFKGVNHAAQHWFTTFVMAPDVVVQLKNTDVHYSSGKIMASVSFSATKMYEDPLDMAVCQNLVEQELNRLEIDNATNEKRLYSEYSNRTSSLYDSRLTINKLMSSVQKTIRGLTLRAVPEPIHATGTFVMHTDENKRITFMEWVADCCM